MIPRKRHNSFMNQVLFNALRILVEGDTRNSPVERIAAKFVKIAFSPIHHVVLGYRDIFEKVAIRLLLEQTATFNHAR